MSTHVASAPAALPADTTAANASKALAIGLVFTALTALGLFVSGAQKIATSWLVGVMFWTAIAVGMLLMVVIHHIFDAKWSVVLRRQLEHGLSAFKWLALLFLPLILGSLFYQGDIVWPWMNPEHLLHGHGTVAEDVLYAKKSVLLNVPFFVVISIVFFGTWILLSFLLRKASFAQDRDGDPKWTVWNRKVSAVGIPVVALTLTFAAIFWIKTLEYHWFSTMYGVWFFANCYRGALS